MLGKVAKRGDCATTWPEILRIWALASPRSREIKDRSEVGAAPGAALVGGGSGHGDGLGQAAFLLHGDPVDVRAEGFCADCRVYRDRGQGDRDEYQRQPTAELADTEDPAVAFDHAV